MGADQQMGEYNQTSGPVLTTISKAFRVIEYLHDHDGAGVTEVANALNLPKSTIHSYLNTLASEDYVVKSGDKYQVSWQFLRIGGMRRYRTQLYQIAREELKSLTLELDELTNLIVEENGLGVLLLRVRFPACVDDNDSVGQYHYLHTTAGGKAILAHLSERRRSEIIARRGLPAATNETTTREDELLDELEEIRDRGFAVSSEAHREGLSAVACAILDPNDDVVGAISVSGPATRITPERVAGEISEGILRAKNVIELKIRHD